jgi:hypothetical protein
MLGMIGFGGEQFWFPLLSHALKEQHREDFKSYVELYLQHFHACRKWRKKHLTASLVNEFRCWWWEFIWNYKLFLFSFPNRETVFYRNIGWGDFEGYERLEVFLRWDAFKAASSHPVNKVLQFAQRLRNENIKERFNELVLKDAQEKKEKMKKILKCST